MLFLYIECIFFECIIVEHYTYYLLVSCVMISHIGVTKPCQNNNFIEGEEIENNRLRFFKFNN